ncbi:MAG TPA: hypothetical protein VJB14_15335 [Planctomycetota bacterium]|nr:hypothetical protein [Planctomycetota bacterium]
MNCPACGRPLATGAQKCVYCAGGTKFKPKAQLVIPKGTVPEHSSGFRWGRWLLLLIVVGGGAMAWFTPPIRAQIQPLIDKVKGFF